ncbi:hypothetical protein DFH09DRAFT_1462756 [Mycena vulgaris]|nr:hypothetical protein DFH09DRAFT_1462756 [Mycena vulgaris]
MPLPLSPDEAPPPNPGAPAARMPGTVVTPYRRTTRPPKKHAPLRSQLDGSTFAPLSRSPTSGTILASPTHSSAHRHRWRAPTSAPEPSPPCPREPGGYHQLLNTTPGLHFPHRTPGVARHGAAQRTYCACGTDLLSALGAEGQRQESGHATPSATETATHSAGIRAAASTPDLNCCPAGASKTANQGIRGSTFAMVVWVQQGYGICGGISGIWILADAGHEISSGRPITGSRMALSAAPLFFRGLEDLMTVLAFDRDVDNIALFFGNFEPSGAPEESSSIRAGSAGRGAVEE